MFQSLGMEKKELHLGVFPPPGKTADVGSTFLEVPSPRLCTLFLSEFSPLGAAGDRLLPGTSKAALMGDFWHGAQ